ncbi:hypothetical protein AB0B25_15680 [Nocardia sp. NPDC049190]|uniref:hypothetical protein n=1 Tax=Nocardia sp. NPDC049190 TaxID=3155650 RepID=UPI00340085C8
MPGDLLVEWPESKSTGTSRDGGSLMLVNFLNRMVFASAAETSGPTAAALDEDAALRRKESEYQKYLLTRTFARITSGV